MYADHITRPALEAGRSGKGGGKIAGSMRFSREVQMIAMLSSPPSLWVTRVTFFLMGLLLHCYYSRNPHTDPKRIRSYAGLRPKWGCLGLPFPETMETPALSPRPPGCCSRAKTWRGIFSPFFIAPAYPLAQCWLLCSSASGNPEKRMKKLVFTGFSVLLPIPEFLQG